MAICETYVERVIANGFDGSNRGIFETGFERPVDPGARAPGATAGKPHLFRAEHHPLTATPAQPEVIPAGRQHNLFRYGGPIEEGVFKRRGSLFWHAADLSLTDVTRNTKN